MYKDGVLLFTDSPESYQSRPYLAIGDRRAVNLVEETVMIGPGIDQKTVQLKFETCEDARSWAARLRADAQMETVERLATFKHDLDIHKHKVGDLQESHETKIKELEEEKKKSGANHKIYLDKLRDQLDKMLKVAHENEGHVEDLTLDLAREMECQPTLEEIQSQAQREEALTSQDPQAAAVSDVSRQLQRLLSAAEELERKSRSTQQSAEEMIRQDAALSGQSRSDQSSAAPLVARAPAVYAAPPARNPADAGGQRAEYFEGEAPGTYQILTDSTSVTEAASINSADLPTTLRAGTIVQVLELSVLKVEGRIRGRIAKPSGWISLKMIGSDVRWAIAEGSAIENTTLRQKLQDMQIGVQTADVGRGSLRTALNGSGSTANLASSSAVLPSHDPEPGNFTVGQRCEVWSATQRNWFDDGFIAEVASSGITVRYNSDQTTKSLPYKEIKEHARMLDPTAVALKQENQRLKDEIARLSTIQPASAPETDVRPADLQREADEHRRLAEEADRRCAEALEQARRDKVAFETAQSSAAANQHQELASYAEKQDMLSQERLQFQRQLQQQDRMIADIRADAVRVPGRGAEEQKSELQTQLEIQTRRVQDLEEATRAMERKEAEKSELQRTLEQQIVQLEADKASLNDGLLQVRRSDEHKLIAGERAASLEAEVSAAQATARDVELRLRHAEGMAQAEKESALLVTEERNSLQSRLAAAEEQKEMAERLSKSEADSRESEQPQDSDRVQKCLERIQELQAQHSEAEQRAGQAQARAGLAERRATQSEATLQRVQAERGAVPAVASQENQGLQDVANAKIEVSQLDDSQQGFVASSPSPSSQRQASESPVTIPRSVPAMPSLRGPAAYPTAAAASANVVKPLSSPSARPGGRLSSDGGRPSPAAAVSSARDGRTAVAGTTGRSVLGAGLQSPSSLRPASAASGSVRPASTASGMTGATGARALLTSPAAARGAPAVHATGPRSSPLVQAVRPGAQQTTLRGSNLAPVSRTGARPLTTSTGTH